MKGVEKYIDAVWSYDNTKYILIDEAVSKKTFQRGYKEKAKLYYLKELFKEVSGLNSGLLENIKGSNIIQDPMKIIQILQTSLKSGSFAGTTEHLLNKLEDINDKLKNIESIKIKILQNIFNSVVESCQAFMVSKGYSFIVPSQLIAELEKRKILDSSTIENLKSIIKFYKDYEHGIIKEIKGRDLDLLIKKLNLFKEKI
jgi:hypothetical protein